VIPPRETLVRLMNSPAAMDLSDAEAKVMGLRLGIVSTEILTLGRISEIVTAAVDDWIGANEQPDDVTLVLARVR